MKKGLLLVALLGVLFSSTIVQAANKLTMAGCGLGYMLFAKDNPSDQVLQVLAVTTNGTSMNNLFGITSGTLGCTEDGMIASNRELEVYAEVNFQNLSQEMAQGGGEFVTAFTSLLGAGDEKKPALISFFKDHYEELFPTLETTSTQMLENLNLKLSTHPELL